ncbi:B3 domain-containing transcription factor VRN1 [Bienertia sinuspersici]
MRSTRLTMIQKTQMQAKTSQRCNNPMIQFDSDNTKPYFFKLFVNPLCQKQQLRIPMEFGKKYGMYLSDDICLNVPNSELPWEVKLEKDSNNNMFLGKGWQALSEFYGLEYGSFLLFRFDGGSSKSQFHLLIFDKTAVEIDYPVRCSSNSSTTMTTTKTETTEKGDDDDVSIEILDENDSQTLDKSVEIVDLDTSDSDDAECSSYKGKGRNVPCTSKKEMFSNLDEFESLNPHFKAIMYPSHVHNRYKRNVPFDHAKKYFTSKSKEIILKGPNGKRHRVRYYVGKKEQSCCLVGKILCWIINYMLEMHVFLSL